MLKWIDAYDHYLPLLYNDGDHVKQKENFFEFLQGEDENSLEWLHQCVELFNITWIVSVKLKL